MTATAKKATGMRRTMSCQKYPSRRLRRGLDETSVFSALDAVALPPIMGEVCADMAGLWLRDHAVDFRGVACGVTSLEGVPSP